MPLGAMDRTKQSRVTLDATLFDPALLQDEIVVENALGILEGHLMNPAVDRQSLLTELISKRNLFEFVFSGKCPFQPLLSVYPRSGDSTQR